ncbi:MULTISPECIES: sulfotransferase family 2 domain-containing protein [Marinobacter]|uniref:sulfotransferase family 2 domain-containing protein n=1 Tax=Marinobacter TaxID=2742 RepID=UPI0013A6988C|nr:MULTISPECIES: sulfotransferase family 2 domain-containing protein [Marinobacter]
MKHDIWEKLPPQLYLQLKRWDYRLKEKGAFEAAQRLRQDESPQGYSFRPFDRQRAIFVQVPRCAGMAISQTLFGNLSGGHTTLEQYLNIFEPRCVAEYFKFAFVRNPWDRLVSIYASLRDGGGSATDRRLYEQELKPHGDFETFVRRWLTRRNVRKWTPFCPQYHFMLDRREMVKLDFVGFVENIEQDFRQVAARLGASASLPMLNRGETAHYTEFYTPETRDIVAEVYAEDIRLLGYSFDNENLPQQIAGRDQDRVYTLRS